MGIDKKRCLQSTCSFLSSTRTTVLFHPLSGRQQNMDQFNRKCVCEHAQKICLFKSSCEFSNYHPSFCSPFIHSVVSNAPFIHSVVSNDFISAQQSPWSNCMAAQADLGLSYLICPKTCWYALTNKRAGLYQLLHLQSDQGFCCLLTKSLTWLTCLRPKKTCFVSN